MQDILQSGAPPYLSAISILAGTIIAGKIVKWVFEKILLSLVGTTKTKIDDQIINVTKQPVFWSVILIGGYITAQTFGLPEKALDPINNTLVTAGIIFWGIAGIGISRIFFTKLEEKIEDGQQNSIGDLLPFLDNVVIIAAAIIIILTILSVWGINITPALASAGVVGIAVAFAAKDTVANIFGGVSIFLDKPYKTGDYVIIKDTYRGEVIQIGMRSTKIRTRDNVLLTVPNSILATDAVINETGLNPELRIRVPLGVSYSADLDKVENILVDVTSAQKYILKDPKPRVRFRKFGDFAVELEVMGTIAQPSKRGRTIHELVKAITKRLQKEKIEVPFPQQVVHLKQN